MKIIQFIFSNFFIWFGFMLLLAVITDFIYKIYNRILRHKTIMKYGYPPEHCDADGNFKEKKND